MLESEERKRKAIVALKRLENMKKYAKFEEMAYYIKLSKTSLKNWAEVQGFSL